MKLDPSQIANLTDEPASAGVDEGAFKKWYGGVSRKLKIDPNPDAPEHHYDYRGFYKAVLSGEEKSPDKPGGHFTSRFKTAGHPREYLADRGGKVFSTVSGKYADGSQVPDAELAAAENAPDLPPERRPVSAAKPAAAGTVRLTPQQAASLQDEPAPAAPAPRDVATGAALSHGAPQTFARSALDMLTFGHHDEISGAIDEAIDSAIHAHLPTSEGYRQHRDVYRQEAKAGNEEHPVAHYAGSAAGVALPMILSGGTAAPALAGGLGKAALKGAAMGALAGEGASEAELTKGEFGKAALDAAVGAGAGAAGGAIGQKVGNWIGNASARADRQLLSDIGQRANRGVRDKMADNAEAVLKTARGRGYEKIATDAPKLLDKASTAQAAAGAKIGQVDQAVEAGFGKMPLDRAVGKLAELEKKLAAVPARAKAVQSVARELIDTFGDEVSPAELRQYTSALGDKAYETLNDNASAKVNRQIYRALSGAMKEHAAAAAKAVPELRPIVRELPRLSEEFGALSEIATAAKQRARLTPYKPTGLRSFTLRGLGESAYDATAGKVTRPLDEKLAALSRLAASGDQRAAALLQVMSRAPARGAAQEAAGAGVGVRAAFAGDEDQPPAMAETP